MPTSIKQIEDPERNRTVLRVEGTMTEQDAVLLEKIAVEIQAETGKDLTLDLADLDFLDSDSGSILKRMEREHGFEIEGIEFFLQKAVDETNKF